MEQPPIKPGVVRKLRLKKHITQQELAEAAHLSLGQVNRIEGGKIERPQFRTVRALAHALDVSPEDLLNANTNGDNS